MYTLNSIEAKKADVEVKIYARIKGGDIDFLGYATFATADKYTQTAIEKYGASLIGVYRRYEATHPTSPLYVTNIHKGPAC